METSTRFDADELLRHVGWMRELALQIARDPDVADDVAQDAVLVALRDAPHSASSPRGWLARVVRNVWRTSYRSEQRRSFRESRSARSESAPSTLELIERASVQRSIVGELLELPEPYCETLLLRYFEELTQAEIGARMNVPASTVATRIAEGLARLRRRLGAGDAPEHTARAALLAPLLGRGRNARLPVSLTGAVSMGVPSKSILTASVVVAAALGIRTLTSGDGAEHSRSGARADLPANLELPDDVAVVSSDSGRSRDSMQSGAELRAMASAAEVPTVALPEHMINGSVLGLNGRPVAGIEVERVNIVTMMPPTNRDASEPMTERVKSDSRGQFSMGGTPPFYLRVRSDSYAALNRLEVPERSDDHVLIVVAPRVAVEGIVVDSEGVAIEAATVLLNLPKDALDLPGRDLRRLALRAPEATTDEFGLFELPDVPDLPGSVLQTRAAGFLNDLRKTPMDGMSQLKIVLQHARDSAYQLIGRVVLESGSPAPGALISSGNGAVEADRNGRFILDLKPWLSQLDRTAPVRLVGARSGSLPAKVELPSIETAQTAGWPEIVLVLGSEPLSISGRVVDPDGNPVRGVLVDALDQEVFGLVQGQSVSWMHRVTLEETIGNPSWYVHANGEFSVGGLTRRDYRIVVQHHPSLLTVVTDPIRAGSSEVEVEFDFSLLGDLAGRVVDRDGAPVANVSVSAVRGKADGFAIGVRSLTDEDGHFLLEDVGLPGLALRLTGEQIIPQLMHEIADDTDAGDVRVVVDRRCEVVFDFADWAWRADELRLLDSDDVQLTFFGAQGGGLSKHESIAVGEGETEVFWAARRVTSVVLVREGEEVLRVPLMLLPGERQTVRL